MNEINLRFVVIKCIGTYAILIITLTATPSLGGFGFPTSSDGIHPNIPPSLLECYNSTYITTRDNLLPMTVNTLIALVRKLEESVPSMDVRTMSRALLTNYRFDGIIYRSQLDPQGIQYAVEGNEFSLWKLLSDKIIANTGYPISNDTLTWVERCTLHRMLSMSVDFERSTDVDNCPQLDKLVSWNSRYPRELSKLDDVEIIAPKTTGGESRIVNDNDEDQVQSGNFLQDVTGGGGYYQSRCPLENGVIRNKFGGAISPGIVLAGIAAGSQPQTVPTRNLFLMQPRAGSGLKRKNQGYPNNPNYNVNNAGYNPNNPGYNPNNPGYNPNNPGYNPSISSYNPNNSGYKPAYNPNSPGYNPNNPGFNPNVNAYARPQSRTFFANQYGSGGTYGGSGPNGGRAGIGTGTGTGTGGGGYGGYPNYGDTGSNYPTASELPVPSNIDNKYAATLAGELAYVVVWMGPLREGMQIGLDGGWNDTIVPKYYFLQDPIPNALTDARIRGSIDGLLLASNVENWVNAAGTLKLSQLLNMYYSTKGVFSTDVKSCKRRDYYQQVAPINTLKDQTYSAAYVLSELAPYMKDKMPYLSEAAATAVGNYIPTLQDPACPTDIKNTPKPAPVVDLHLVLDYNWDYKYASRAIQYIIDNLELWKFGGNFSLINGRDATVVIDSSHSPLDFPQNFTYYYGNGGFDFTKILSQLKLRFQQRLETDKLQYSGGGIPRVVVFMPYSATSMSDTETISAKNRIQYFKETLPDVKFYFLVTGNKNNYSPYVDDDKDIFVISPGSDIPSSLDPFINALTTTPRRLINPNCGKDWRGTWYNEIVLNGYLDSNEIHYYRISPNYFYYSGTDAKITISTEGSAPVLTVCSSRDNAMPIANLSRSSSVTCKQITGGNRYDLHVTSNDCGSVYYAFQCKPFYFSIANQQAPSRTQIAARCTDQECRDPDMTKYTIRHVGLSCYSGVGKLLISTPLVIILLFINIFRIV
ncbi:hypothetical protein O3M35_007695 [Rhynocoris fuscipes]|uniref:Uncharacterized protein n=1 Tax=Rhynocoris fuscipes TaxID=488301 RepID=A0AAW1DHM1_9HEMI